MLHVMRKVFTSRTAVTVYFDREEAKRLEDAAGGKSLSAYVRTAILAVLPKRYVIEDSESAVTPKTEKPRRVEKVIAPIPESPLDPPTAKPTGYRNIKVTLFPGKKCRQHGVFECTTGDCYKWVREE